MSKLAVSKPHDHAFRASMANKQVAIEFFQAHLPKVIMDAIDIESLAVSSDTFISKELKLTESDILYSVTLFDTPAYIYILSEHQRNPDSLMPFRLLEYIVAIIRKHLQQHPNETLLPLVIPLVFYNGKKPYPYTTDIKEIMAAPRALVDAVLFQPFTLVDTHTLSDEELKKRYFSGLMEMIFKHIDDGNVLDWLPACLTLFQEVEKTGGIDYILTLVKYTTEAGETQNPLDVLELVSKHLSTTSGEKIMTIAEQLRQEGRQEGIQTGIQTGEANVLLRQLETKFGQLSEKDIKRIQTLGTKELLDLSVRVLTAKTIREILH